MKKSVKKTLEKFDAIVVGAGTAGCMAAKTVAEAGLKVCLIDRKNREAIGEKVCGDAIGKHHFDNLGLAPPTGKELERKVEGVKIFPPDVNMVYRVKGTGVYGFIINRLLFGQRLLRDALTAGATLFHSVQVLEPIIEKGFVVGVEARNLKTDEKMRLNSKVVVEASGFSAVLRAKLSQELGIQTNIDKKDVAICYREIRKLKEQIDEPTIGEMYFNQEMVPGGYAWIFPEGENRVNVGLGVAMVDGFPSPKKKLYNFILNRPVFKASTVVTGGGGHVPIRRPLSCTVGNGIILAGDAAAQGNPIHGGGIGPSMISGTLSGKTIIGALEKGDTSREILWPYQIRYLQAYGMKQAGLDVFRLFLQSLSNDDLNQGIKYRLITEEDLLRTTLGEEIRLNITKKALRALSGLRNLRLLRKLRNAASLTKKVKAWYLKYPESPEGLEKWKNKTQDLFREVEKKSQRSTAT
jgi:digeranylgeranylglycerophospholipid reductase